MSRVAKEIGRGFKKITREIRNFFREPIVRTAVIAVMAYFTVGAAFGAMGAGGATAGAGSGVAGAAGTSGAVSSAAVTGAQLSPMWIGAGAGGAGTVGSAAGTLAGIEGLVAGGTAAISNAGALVSGVGAGGATAAGVGGALSEIIPTVAERTTTFTQPSVWDKIANFTADIPSKAGDWWGGLSAGEKANMLKMGVDIAGAAFGPDPEEIYNAKYAAENKWRGAGLADLPGGSTMTEAEMNAERGNLFGGQPDSAPQGATPPSEQLFSDPAPAAPGPVEAGPRPAVPQQLGGQDLFAGAAPPDEMQQQSMLFGEGQMQQMLPVPSSLTGITPTPGVRYIDRRSA